MASRRSHSYTAAALWTRDSWDTSGPCGSCSGHVLGEGGIWSPSGVSKCFCVSPSVSGLDSSSSSCCRVLKRSTTQWAVSLASGSWSQHSVTVEQKMFIPCRTGEETLSLRIKDLCELQHVVVFRIRPGVASRPQGCRVVRGLSGPGLSCCPHRAVHTPGNQMLARSSSPLQHTQHSQGLKSFSHLIVCRLGSGCSLSHCTLRNEPRRRRGAGEGDRTRGRVLVKRDSDMLHTTYHHLLTWFVEGTGPLTRWFWSI